MRDGWNQCRLARMWRITPVLCLLLLAACSAAAVESQAGHGRRVFTEHCASCHSLSADVVIVGPSLAGIATRARLTGDARQYIEDSITSPSAVVVDGFQDLMPPDFRTKLPPQEFEAVVAFLLTLE